VVEFLGHDTASHPPEKRRSYSRRSNRRCGTARTYAARSRTGHSAAAGAPAGRGDTPHPRVRQRSTFTWFCLFPTWARAYNRAVTRGPTATVRAAFQRGAGRCGRRRSRTIGNLRRIGAAGGEDDPHYCRILLDLARQRGVKILLARTGADALTLAREVLPERVSLDLFPRHCWLDVLNQLNRNPATRHIPFRSGRSRTRAVRARFGARSIQHHDRHTRCSQAAFAASELHPASRCGGCCGQDPASS